MDNLVVLNRKKTIAEILIDFDYPSFKYVWSKNDSREVSFTAVKNNVNEDVFNLLQNEGIVQWGGQDYIIKSMSIKSDNVTIVKDVVCKHIYMEFQNHFIDKDLESEEMNGDVENEVVPSYTLEQYLDFGFKNNLLGFDYVINGNFDKRVSIEDLGDKNGLEYIVEGADIFGYIYFADNKTIHFYDEESFYEHSNEVIRYKYNTDEVQATINTNDMRTLIKGYGQKKTKKETKNYNPVKTPALKYDGSFIKKGTWRTESIGASFEAEIDCLWGNETLTYNFKKGVLGGLWNFYLDDEYYDTISAWSRNTTSENLVVAKNLSKGVHKFKGVFKGGDPNINYKEKKPVGYVGTEKFVVFNTTAILKGEELYKYHKTIKSENYDVFGHKQEATVYEDDIESLWELEEILREKLVDTPTVEVSTNYLGSETDKRYIYNGMVKENSIVRLKHDPLNYNTDLKVVKLTESHPLMNEPVEIEFSNSSKNIIQIQQKINSEIKKINQSSNKNNIYNSEVIGLDYDIIGSVSVDE